MFTMLLSLICSNLLYFALHVEGHGSFPKPLSPKREQECFEQMAAGDEAARNELIEHNLRLVAHIIKKYYASSNDQDDLISIGSIGLVKAVNTFKYEKGTRFATYASRCIENAILSQRNNRRLRWRNGCLLRQNGTCWREWESAAIF